MALLTHVTVKVSGIIPAPIEEVWKIVRIFGGIGRWMHPVHSLSDVKSQLLPGCVEGQVGAMRIVTMGLSSYVEQLECLDEEALTIKWKLISHPLNTNPFPATFLNLKGSVVLMDVTRDKATYMVWTSDFDTDFEGMDAMRTEITARLETGFEGLTALLKPLHPPSTLLSHLSIKSGSTAPLIGSVPLTTPSDSGGAGSPPSMNPLLGQAAALQQPQQVASQVAAQSLGADIPVIPPLSAMQQQSELNQQAATLQQQQQQGISQALQESVLLGDMPTDSFTFPSFLGPANTNMLPQQSFMDAESLIWSQQRRLDAILAQKEQESRASIDSAATSRSAPAGLGQPSLSQPSFGHSNTGQSNLGQSSFGGLDAATFNAFLQLQREYPNLEPHQIESIVGAAQHTMDPMRAFIQQGHLYTGSNIPSQGSAAAFHDSLQQRQDASLPTNLAFDRRGDSAGSDITPKSLSPMHSPRGSLGSRKSSSLQSAAPLQNNLPPET